MTRTHWLLAGLTAVLLLNLWMGSVGAQVEVRSNDSQEIARYDRYGRLDANGDYERVMTRSGGYILRPVAAQAQQPEQVISGQQQQQAAEVGRVEEYDQEDFRRRLRNADRVTIYEAPPTENPQVARYYAAAIMVSEYLRTRQEEDPQNMAHFFYLIEQTMERLK